jgi:hypothetical protein
VSDSLEDLIALVHFNSFRVLNLFERDGLDGSVIWQANVTDGKKVWEFAHSHSPTVALREALVKALRAEGEAELRAQRNGGEAISSAASKSTELSLEELLG